MLFSDKMRLNQRGIIESVNDPLKNMCQIAGGVTTPLEARQGKALTNLW